MFVLMSDFDLNDPYLGQVKAVLHHACPNVPIIDLFSNLPAYQIQAAAYLLPAYCVTFPDNSIFLCIVDPGVGSEREIALVRANEQWFIGPDNGLFTLLARFATIDIYGHVRWQPLQLSNSFHGRDWMAPIAVKLALGQAIEMQTVDEPNAQYAHWPDDWAHITYIDHYGNAMTGIRSQSLHSSQKIIVNDTALHYARTFSEVAEGQCFWYHNSNELVEIACNQGRAADCLQLKTGDRIVVQ